MNLALYLLTLMVASLPGIYLIHRAAVAYADDPRAATRFVIGAVLYLVAAFYATYLGLQAILVVGP